METELIIYKDKMFEITITDKHFTAVEISEPQSKNCVIRFDDKIFLNCFKEHWS